MFYIQIIFQKYPFARNEVFWLINAFRMNNICFSLNNAWRIKKCHTSDWLLSMLCSIRYLHSVCLVEYSMFYPFFVYCRLYWRNKMLLFLLNKHIVYLTDYHVLKNNLFSENVWVLVIEEQYCKVILNIYFSWLRIG